VNDGTAPCEVGRCGQNGLVDCARCGRRICARHTVADFNYLPGGQRPYCVECDAERQELYRSYRVRGLRAILFSGGGALIGSVLGYLVAALVTADSFTHSIITDVGFMVGLAVALLASLRSARL
jgi:hypothetical protein